MRVDFSTQGCASIRLGDFQFDSFSTFAAIVFEKEAESVAPPVVTKTLDVACMKPSDIVELLSPTTGDLSSRVSSINKVFSTADCKITGRFLYVPFRDSKPTVDDLITVAHARLVNFAIPKIRITEALAEMAANPGVMDPWVLLSTEARDLFIKTKKETGRSGELGEVLLYMLMEWVLKAPIVACKMYLKTSRQMPIHGTDGIHVGHEGDNLLMYWGESKMHSKLSSALSDIATSIAKISSSPKDRENEIRIIRSNLNLDGISESGKKALKNYFNPYAPESNMLLDCYACLAGFDYAIYDAMSSKKHDECDAVFRKEYELGIESIWKSVIQKSQDEHLRTLRFTYFLFPFPSVDAARQKFQDKLWGATA